MRRFLVSFLVALLIGAGIGLYLGWVQFPVQFVDSPANALAASAKDEYTLMIAGAYADDGDLNGAVERLRVLGVDNVPAYVQEVTERYITNSRGIDDIRLLVRLAEGMGRLTPVMEPYRQLALPGQGA
ncbi:MAG: hypothetical protein KC547_19435 [Anaerolineae bacterium]|nr:hypothetical protein [Anaerolineae bacterium]